MRLKAREKATRFVSRVNRIIKCQECGGYSIEWHKNGHESQPNSRVSSLRAQGCSIERIKKEMRLSIPLCRSCHMKIDGRTNKLLHNRPFQKGKEYIPKRHCIICDKLYKPLRKKMCYCCYEKHRLCGRNFQHEYTDNCCIKRDR